LAASGGVFIAGAFLDFISLFMIHPALRGRIRRSASVVASSFPPMI
jgi:hypothetical protein